MADNTIVRFGSDAQAVRFSADGTLVYALTSGIVDKFSAATGAYQGALVNFGQLVNGFDISPDGRYIYATVFATTNEMSSGNTSARDVTILRYDATNGHVDSFSTRVLNDAGAFFDIELLANGKVLLTEAGGIGTPLYTFDPVSGIFTPGPVTGGYKTIVSSADGSLQFVSGDLGGKTIATIDAQGNQIAVKLTTSDNVFGTQTGQAISASAHMVLLGTDSGLHLYDTNLVYQRDLLPQLKQETLAQSLTGLAFSADGSKLYALSPDTQAVFEFSTADWSLLRSFAIGTQVLLNGGQGDKIVLSPDGRYLDINDYNQFRIDLTTTNQITGTPNADTLIGTAAPDLIHGGAGNDRIEGGGGSDTLYGDDGDDTYVVVAKGDTTAGPPDVVVERANGGNDTVITSVAFTLPANVETLQLAPGAIATITSSAGGGTLIGNELGTLLVGSTGVDTFIGGGGDDTLQGGLGDIAVFRDTLAHAHFEIVRTFTRSGLSVYNLVVNSADGRDQLGIVVNRDTQGGLTASGISTLRFDDVSISTLNLVAAEVTLETALGTPPSDAVLATFARLTATTPADNVRTTILASAEFKSLTDQQITALYQDYGGRPPAAAELAFWEGQVRGGTTIAAVRHAILVDPLGHDYSPTAINKLYVEFGGRPATKAETDFWYGQMLGTTTLNGVRHAILIDPLGTNHANAVINELYLDFGGRAAVTAELAHWRDHIIAGGDFGDVRHAILVDPLGVGHSNAEINQLYIDYGGRAATMAELDYWRGQIVGGSDFNDVRHAILVDPLGQNHTVAETTALYQEYFGRVPTAGEIGVWKGLILNGATFATLTDALMTDSGSNGHIERLSGTAAADRFDLGATIDHVTIAGFDAANDKIDLHATAFANNPLAHATQVTAVDGSTDVIVSFSPDDTILLQHVQLAQLSAGNFI